MRTKIEKNSKRKKQKKVGSAQVKRPKSENIQGQKRARM